MLDIPDFKPLDNKFFTLMLVRRLVFSLLLIAGGIIFFISNKNKEIPNYVFLIIGLVILLFVIIYISLTKVFFKKKKYKIQDTNLSYKKGLLVSQLTVVPFSRIQHIEIEEGPFERYFKLSSISIYTAGDSGKDLKISGLKTQSAKEIKELITAYIKDE